MNDDLHINAHGLRLLTHYEQGPEGGPALEPYLCPAEKLTIGYGCTEWFDGGKVQWEHRLSDEAGALKLLAAKLKPYEDAVRRGITVPLNSNQFSAHVCLAFNIGINAYLGDCSARKLMNLNQVENSAEAFARWTGATATRPTPKQAANPGHALRIAHDAVGAHWISPDGQKCSYMTRLPGLLARHLSEALLDMGYAWEEAVDYPDHGRIFLSATTPDKTPFNAAKNRWEESTVDQTRLSTVLRIAQAYPLPDPDAALETAGEDLTGQATQPTPSDLTPEVVIVHSAVEEASHSQEASPAVLVQPVPASAPASPQPPLVIPPTPAPPAAPIKDILTSRRGWGTILNTGGHLIQVGGVTAPFGLGPVLRGFSKTYGAVINDPVTLDLACGAAVFTTGWILMHGGAWLKRWGEINAKHPLGTAHEVAVARARP